MMFVSKYKKIYILCPIGTKTGGTELLHQLVYKLNNIAEKKIAYIVYTGDTNKVKPAAAFKEYIGNEWLKVNQIEDKGDNAIIIPETSLEYFEEFNNIQKIIWWLSVDNFYNTNYFSRLYKQYGLIHTISGYIKGSFKNRTKLIKYANLNLYQSYYAQNFLNENNISMNTQKYLSDYINDLYTNDVNKALNHKKENIILYNPKKGLSFTKKLIAASSDLTWIPLINLTNEEVRKLLIKSKVYVDFGTHPGKDRFPREAAISGCCILTDKRGSAKYYEDVPIEDEYKFDDVDKNIQKIILKIRYCFDNYNNAINDFNNYRNYILHEKSNFESDVKNIFFNN